MARSPWSWSGSCHHELACASEQTRETLESWNVVKQLECDYDGGCHLELAFAIVQHRDWRAGVRCDSFEKCQTECDCRNVLQQGQAALINKPKHVYGDLIHP